MTDELEELAARLGRDQAVAAAECRRHQQALAGCVVRLAKAVDALQDQVTMIREAAGLAPDRRDS